MKDAIIISVFVIVLAYIFGAFTDASFFIWEWKQSTRNACAGFGALVLVLALLGVAMEKTK